ALKVLCTLVFSLVSLAVFITQGQVWWSVALTLAAGNTIGSMIGVKMSLKLNPQVIRWVLFVMTIVAAVSALLK
ncbi:MAG: sulfite exporter TauE/SafE family protein, partial [Brachymonas sp.]|nr:sulfite exporter TauE/SafE family protein [Brachymonas sp.]